MDGPNRTDIWKMFDQISGTYDRVNRAMTLGLDQYWRGQLAKYLPDKPNLYLLDCATGTADQILALMNKVPHIGQAVGIDLAEAMLSIGQEKIKRTPHASKVQLHAASALELPFPDATFDCATISFGIRNLTDTLRGLQEMHRVLSDGGRALILECSLPKNALLRKFHLFYLRYLLPKIGGWLSSQKDAYIYLNKTIETFPSGPAFLSLLSEAGFATTSAHPFLGGVVTLYIGNKEQRRRS